MFPSMLFNYYGDNEEKSSSRSHTLKLTGVPWGDIIFQFVNEIGDKSLEVCRWNAP